MVVSLLPLSNALDGYCLSTVNTSCLFERLVDNADVVAYELKSKLIVFDVLVNGAENVNIFSFAFKFVIVA